MLYLASRSPQRAFLLTRAGIRFTVVDSTCDEETILCTDPRELALQRARAKAAAAVVSAEQLAEHPAVVLGADTVAALDGQLFGKPVDQADAVRILGLLQGTSHTVYTGHCCRRVDGDQVCEAADVAMTRVHMKPMSQAEIAAYVASGESAGRAGAYAIQETGDRFVARLDGSWDTVVGLHVAMTERLYHDCSGYVLTGERS